MREAQPCATRLVFGSNRSLDAHGALCTPVPHTVQALECECPFVAAAGDGFAFGDTAWRHACALALRRVVARLAAIASGGDASLRARKASPTATSAARAALRDVAIAMSNGRVNEARPDRATDPRAGLFAPRTRLGARHRGHRLCARLMR